MQRRNVIAVKFTTINFAESCEEKEYKTMKKFYDREKEMAKLREMQRQSFDDYKTFSGISLERWFRQRMVESFGYKQVEGWWLNNDRAKNARGNSDDFEIDIVAVSTDNRVEAYEVKRNPDRYRQSRLKEKVAEMQKHVFKGCEVSCKGLSMEDM